MTNGMSEYARDGENINGGLLVNVTPEDFEAGIPWRVSPFRDGWRGGLPPGRRVHGAVSAGGGLSAAPAQYRLRRCEAQFPARGALCGPA